MIGAYYQAMSSGGRFSGSRRWLPFAVGAAVVVVVGAVLWLRSAAPSGSPPSQPSGIAAQQPGAGQFGAAAGLAPVPQTMTASPLGSQAAQVQERGERQFPDVFAGDELTRQQSHLVVYLTTLEPATEATIRGPLPADEVSFQQVTHSWAWLMNLEHSISNDANSLRGQGVQLASWGPDPATNKETITVVGLDPVKAATLDNRYGAANIELRDTAAVAMGGPEVITLTAPPTIISIAPNGASVRISPPHP